MELDGWKGDRRIKLKSQTGDDKRPARGFRAESDITGPGDLETSVENCCFESGRCEGGTRRGRTIRNLRGAKNGLFSLPSTPIIIKIASRVVMIFTGDIGDIDIKWCQLQRA